jgi:hypothetical protein
LKQKLSPDEVIWDIDSDSADRLWHRWRPLRRIAAGKHPPSNARISRSAEQNLSDGVEVVIDYLLSA